MLVQIDMKKAAAYKRGLKEFQPLDKRQKTEADFLTNNVKPAIVDKLLLASNPAVLPQKPAASNSFDPFSSKSEATHVDSALTDEDSDDDEAGGKKTGGRRKITIQFVEDKSKRHITFSKRKTGSIKKVVTCFSLCRL